MAYEGDFEEPTSMVAVMGLLLGVLKEGRIEKDMVGCGGGRWRWNRAGGMCTRPHQGGTIAMTTAVGISTMSKTLS